MTDTTDTNATAAIPPRCILAVSDDPSIRHLLRFTFGGYRILDASGPDNALELLSDKPALVVVDLDFEKIQGDDFLLVLRQRDHLIPIVALSTRLDERTIVRALDAGADAYLTKPVGTKELFARIHDFLRRTRRAVPDKGALRRGGGLSVDLFRRVVKVGEKAAQVQREPSTGQNSSQA